MASKPIDEKIIKLSVEDASFKDKLAAAAKTLTVFDKAIGAVKGTGLNAVSSAAEKAGTAVSEIGDKASGVSGKFSVMAGAAAVALGNIATNALNTGLSMVKSLTLDPITQGFQQYQSKMQSMMALQVALGDGAKNSINKAVDELTLYANNTVYSVNDMTGALSTLVNQGIGLKDSVNVIKGFGNAAALAGVDTNTFKSQLDTALTQAYALGHMDYPNFKQLEMSHIVTKQFKDDMLEAAKAQGKNVDLSEGFNASLKTGWADVNVMNAALTKMSQNQAMVDAAQKFHTFSQASDATLESISTGWAGVWEILLGDVDESTALWTNAGNAVGKVIDHIFDSINNLATSFKKLGGMSQLFSIVKIAIQGLLKPIGDIAKAYSKMFPKTGDAAAKALVTVLMLLRNAIKLLLAPMQLIGPIFTLFFAVLRVGIDVIRLLLTPFTTLFKMATKGFDLTKTIIQFTDWSKAMKLVTAVIQAVSDTIHAYFGKAMNVVATSTVNAVKWVKAFFKELNDTALGIKKYGDKLKDLVDPLMMVQRAMTEGTKKITAFMVVIGMFKATMSLISAVLGYVGKSFNNVVAGIKAFFGQLTIILDPLKKLNDHFTEAHPKFKKFETGLTDIGKAMQGFVKWGIGVITGINGLTDSLLKSEGAFVDFAAYATNAGVAVRDFITNMANAFLGSKVVTQARQLGKDIIDGLTIGVKNTALDLWGIVRGPLDTFIRSVKDLFGIHSPSRVMQEIGKNIIEGLSLGVSRAIPLIKQALEGIGKLLVAFIKMMGEGASKLPSVIGKVVRAIGTWLTSMAPYADGIGEIFSGIIDGVTEFVHQINLDTILKGGLIVALAGWLKDLKKQDGEGLLSKLLHPIKAIKDALSGKFGGSSALLDQLKDTLKSYQNELKSKALLNVAFAIGVLTAALFLLASIPGGSLATAAGGMAVAATALAGVYKAMSSVSADEGSIDTAKIVAVSLALSVSVLLLSKAVSGLSSLKPEQAVTGVAAMGIIMASLTKMIEYMANSIKGSMKVQLLEFVGLTLTLSSLAKSVIKLAQLSWEQAARGILSMASVMGLLIITINSLKAPTDDKIISLTGIAFALNLAMLPIIELGIMPMGLAIKGISLVGAVLVILAGVSVLMGSFVGKGAPVKNLLALTVALNLAVVPIIAMGLMPWNSTVRGIEAMAATLAILISAVGIISTIKGSATAGIGAIIGIAFAMNALAPIIIIMGALPWQVVTVGLLAFAAALGITIAAAFLAEKVIVGMAALAGVLTAFAAAASAFGIGTMLAVAALGALVALAISEGPKLVEAFGKILSAIGNLGPVLGTAIATLIGGFIVGLARAVSAHVGDLISIAVDLVGALVDGILSASDKLINGAMTLLNKLVQAVLNELPIMAVMLGNGIMDAMNTLALYIQNNADAILSAGANVIAALIQVVTKALGNALGKIPGIGGELKKKVTEAGNSAVEGLQSTFPPGMRAATEKGAQEAIAGLASKSGEMKEQALGLAKNAKDGATQITSFLSILGVQGGDKFIEGIKNGSIGAEQAGALLTQMAEAGASQGDLKKYADILGGTYGDGIFSPANAEKTANAAKKLPQTAADNAQLTEAQKQAISASGAAGAGGLATGVLSQAGNAQNAGLAVNGGLNNALGQVGNFTGTGATTAKSKADGASSQAGAAKSAAEANNNAMNNALSKTKSHRSAGSTTAGSKVDGVSSKKGAMDKAVSGINSSTDSLGTSKDFSGTGRSMVGSLVSGIQGAWDRAKSTVDSIGKYISDRLKGNSPTKAGYLHTDWYGIVGTGGKIVREFAKGMVKDMPKLENAVNGVGKLISDSMDAVNTTETFSPTITPVISMSSIETMPEVSSVITSKASMDVDFMGMNKNNYINGQMSNTLNSIDSKMRDLNGRIDKLNEISANQITAIEAKDFDVNMDGNKVTQQLATKMQAVQDRNSARLSRLGGVIV